MKPNNWLDLLKDADYLSPADHIDLYQKADEIAKMLYAILKKTRLSKKTVD